MDVDMIAPGLERVIDEHPPLDRIAHGLIFGEGPVWDRRARQLLWVDIIGNAIWKWKPEVGRELVLRPSGYANGMTFDRQGRLVRGERDRHAAVRVVQPDRRQRPVRLGRRDRLAGVE